MHWSELDANTETAAQNQINISVARVTSFTDAFGEDGLSLNPRWHRGVDATPPPKVFLRWPKNGGAQRRQTFEEKKIGRVMSGHGVMTS